jgi:hypothetical protein
LREKRSYALARMRSRAVTGSETAACATGPV